MCRSAHWTCAFLLSPSAQLGPVLTYPSYPLSLNPIPHLSFVILPFPSLVHSCSSLTLLYSQILLFQDSARCLGHHQISSGITLLSPIFSF
jgi:hypothetical protein